MWEISRGGGKQVGKGYRVNASSVTGEHIGRSPVGCTLGDFCGAHFNFRRAFGAARENGWAESFHPRGYVPSLIRAAADAAASRESREYRGEEEEPRVGRPPD